MRLGLFTLIFVGFWSAITLFFDGMTVWNIKRQQAAVSFPTVPGEVTRSEITSHHDSDGTTYRAQVHFSYRVDGAAYEGERYRYGPLGTSSRSTQQRITDRFPVGAEVAVFYNPDDPSDAVLVTGVEGTDLFLCLFLTPFNIIMFGGWAFLGGRLYRRIVKPVAGGVPVLRRGGRVHIRLPRISPVGAGLLTALIISFLAVFAVGLPFGFSPPIPVIGGVWGLVIVAGVFVWLRSRMATGSGAKDLVIDEAAGSLSLPQTFGREHEIVVPIADVEAVRLEQIVHRSTKGGTSYTWAPTLVYRGEGGGREEAKLADWSEESRAKSLARFIETWLGLPDAASSVESLAAAG